MRIEEDLKLMDIHEEIEGSILACSLDLHFYSLPADFKNKDSFDILAHHVLLHVCREIEACAKRGVKVILYHATEGLHPNYDWLATVDGKIRTRLENLVRRTAPARLIERPYDVYKFIDEFNAKEAQAIEAVQTVKRKSERDAFKPFNLNKVIKYLDSRGMKYLSQEYFQSANGKLLAMNK